MRGVVVERRSPATEGPAHRVCGHGVEGDVGRGFTRRGCESTVGLHDDPPRLC